MRRRNSSGARLLPALVFATSWLLLASVLPAENVTLQNDSIKALDNAAIQAGFVATERAAAWLTATCDGDLTAVQILWMSPPPGGLPDVLGDAITISDPGAFPVPGTELDNLSGPVLIDQFFNEYDLTAPIAMTAGQKVVVDFKFLSDPDPTVGPSVVTDVEGCQANRNGIYAYGFGIIPDAWYNACSLGVSGDFAIRGVIDCPIPPVFLDGFEVGNTSDWDRTQSPTP